TAGSFPPMRPELQQLLVTKTDAEHAGDARGPQRSARSGVVILSHADTDLLVLHRASEDLPIGCPPVAGESLNGVTTAAALRSLVGGEPGAKLVAIIRVHGAPDSVIGLTELMEEAETQGWHLVVVSGVAGMQPIAGAGALIWPKTSRVSSMLAA